MNVIKVKSGTDLTPLFKSHRRDTQFVLEDGNYACAPAWAFNDDHDHVVLAEGCSIVGAGSGKTFIALELEDHHIPKDACQVELLTMGCRTERQNLQGIDVNEVSVSGVSIYTTDFIGEVGIVGIHSWSGRTILDDVSVSGVMGFRSAPGMPSREGFGILVNGSMNGSGSAMIRNARVDSVNGYACGIFVGIKGKEYGDPISVVEDCVVMCGQESHAALASCGNAAWRNCVAYGPWERGIFCDVTAGEKTLFQNCIIPATKVLIELRGAGPMAWRDFVVANSHLSVMSSTSNRAYAAGLVLATDGGSPEFTRVQVRDSVLANECQPGFPVYRGSADSAHTSDCGFRGCTFYGSPWLPAQFGARVPEQQRSDFLK